MSSDYFGVGIFYVVLICILQSIIGSYFSATKFRYFHETGIAIILGMLLSLVARVGFDYTVSMNNEVFLYAFLPCIVFSEGFSMKKRYFFNNLAYIMFYGLIGTVISFIISISLFHSIFTNNMIQVQIENEEGTGFETVNMNPQATELALFAAALSSKDSFLASTMVDHHAHPILFHIIFGEGIINDASSLILFQSVSYQDATENIDSKLVGDVIITLLESICVSMVCGIFFGVCCAVALKNFSFLMKTSVHEILIVFMTSYASYCISEAFHFSGVVSLLFSGLVIGHFGYYNLSEKAKICSNVTFQILSSGAENFLFAYLGFTTFQFNYNQWNFSLIFWSILFLIIGRVSSVIILSFVLKFIVLKKKWKLKIPEVLSLQLTGITRGVLGYILVNDIDSESYQAIYQTTILGVIIFSTLCFGLINPKLLDFLLPNPHGHGHEATHDHKEQHEEHIEVESHDHKGHENIHHKGEDDDQFLPLGKNPEQKKKITKALLQSQYDPSLFKSKFSYRIQRFNVKYLKPFLIRNYHENFEEITISKELFKENKFELMRPEGISKDQQILKESIQNIKHQIRVKEQARKSLNQNKVPGIPEEEDDVEKYNEQVIEDSLQEVLVIGNNNQSSNLGTQTQESNTSSAM